MSLNATELKIKLLKLPHQTCMNQRIQIRLNTFENK